MFSNNNKKLAFTLAEVLITLGIIGVIAAMTIPTLMLNYQKNITETRLKAFYSHMTQAVGQYLAEEHIEPKDVTFQNIKTSAEFVTWWNDNIGKHFKVSNVEIISAYHGHPTIRITMLDGSATNTYINNSGTEGASMAFFFCVERRFCSEEFYNGVDGRHTFLFDFEPGNRPRTPGRFVTAYDSFHGLSRARLLQECQSVREDKRYACSRLIEMDGWKIKSDYPWF